MKLIILCALLTLAACTSRSEADMQKATLLCADAAPAEKTSCIQTERILIAQERAYRIGGYSLVTRGF